MIKLKSGTEFYAHQDIIGIPPKGEKVDGQPLTEGYNGTIFMMGYNDEKEAYYPKFTKQDLYEIADMMIERWQQFKRDVANEVVLSQKE